LRFRRDRPKPPVLSAKVCSAAVNGIEAYPLEVEVNAGYGDTIIVMIGAPFTDLFLSRPSAERPAVCQ
jgi:hypothetical protein